MNLKTIVVDNANPVYDSRNNCNAIIETATKTLISKCPRVKKPEGVAEKDETRIYELVTDEAQFQKGDLNQWLRYNMRYPDEAKKKKLRGRVFVNFVIEKDGSPTNIFVMASPDSSLSEEAIRLVQSMPKWRPAKHGGRIVRSRFNLPIMFEYK